MNLHTMISEFVNENPILGRYEIEEFLRKIDFGSKFINFEGNEKFDFPAFLEFIENVKNLRIENMPKVGDDVSYQIGTDRYYEGKIVKITSSGIIYTDAGNRYRRRKGTFNGFYRVSDDSFNLLLGVHNYLDPNF